jgi:hypothetical protein
MVISLSGSLEERVSFETITTGAQGLNIENETTRRMCYQ